MDPEQEARNKIDAQLDESGWVIQDRDEINLAAGLGVAIREFKLKRDHGYADYLLFVDPDNRNKRKPTWSEKQPEGRWRAYTYEEIVNRDKASLDIFWLRDESLEDAADLPDPNVLAAEIAEDLESALEQIQGILGDLEERVGNGASE